MQELAPAAGRDWALDFGCGVGRLSLALSTHFARVTGVDASPSMLARAREIAGDRCEFVLNRAVDLAPFGDASVDLAYSSLVLQHLPRDQALLYVRELLRVTRSGGCVVIQVASRPDWSAKGMAFRFAPTRLIGWAQRRLLHYPAPMLMTALPDPVVRAAVGAAGGSVLAVEPDPSYGGHWHYTRYYLDRRDIGRPDGARRTDDHVGHTRRIAARKTLQGDPPHRTGASKLEVQVVDALEQVNLRALRTHCQETRGRGADVIADPGDRATSRHRLVQRNVDPVPSHRPGAGGPAVGYRLCGLPDVDRLRQPEAVQHAEVRRWVAEAES